MIDITTIVLIVVPTLLVGEAVVGIAVWWGRPGVLESSGAGRLAKRLFRWKPLGLRALAGLWLLTGAWVFLTVTSWWCLFLYAYIGVHLLYFGLGLAGAWAGLIIAGALALCVPIVWAAVLIGLARRDFGWAVPKGPASVVGRVGARVGMSR